MGQVLPGVLVDGDPNHERLWQGREEYCSDANIPVEHLYLDPTGLLDGDEIAYFKRGPKRLMAEDHCWGLYYTGSGYKPPVALRMSVMTGWYLRNFIRARVVLLNELLAAIETNDPPDISVVLVPDFYTMKLDKKAMPSWKVRQLYSWLLQRFQKSQQTILAISDINALSQDWGPHVTDHVSEFFAEVTP